MKMFIPDTFMARKKGDAIPQSELIPLVGCGPKDARYSLRVCQIADAMMMLKRRAGDPCTIAQVKGDLKVLSDAEASRYNAAMNDQAVRRIRNTNRRLTEVKVAAFTADEREQHDRRLAVSGARTALTSGDMVRRMVKLSGHQRLLPAIETYRAQRATK